MPCWNSPFYELLGNVKGVKINDFLEKLPSIFRTNVSRNFRTKNYQSFELGLDHLNDDREYIESMLAKIDEQFDLVIPIEHYMEVWA